MRPSALPEFRASVVRRFDAANVLVAEDAARARKREPPTGDFFRDGLLRKRANLTQRALEHQRSSRDLQFGAPGVLRHWQMGELFYVTEDMADLAVQASASMPEFVLHRDDLPADMGMLVMYGADSMVFVWGPDWSEGGAGLRVSVYGAGDGDPSRIVLLYPVQVEYGTNHITPDMSQYEQHFTDDDYWKNKEHTADNAIDWVKVLRCAWLLMQQRVASVTEQRPDRASARRLTRAGVAPDPVRVISLRRSAAGGPPRDSGREYVHRWVVRGHWRKQWYASQGRHVPIWISPFIKGPDDAPLLGGEKVYAWRK